MEHDVDDLLQRIAHKHFNSNMSKAVNWVMRSLFKEGEFLRFQAKHHFALAAFFKGRLDELEGSSEAWKTLNDDKKE